MVDSSERKGGLSSRGSIRSFNEFILRAKVIDIPLHGLKFTWSNNRDVESWARLDIFLISPNFLSWFPSLVQRRHNKSVSDHNPISIGDSVDDWGPKSFRFFNGWLEDKELWEGSLKLGEIVLKKVEWKRPSIRDLLLKRIFVRERNELERDFSVEEVWSVLCDSDGNKAPGLDGLNLNFVKSNWEPRMEYLLNVKRILKCFELTSGLKINFHKLCLVKVGRRESTDGMWAKAFRCANASLPITYLGLPLEGNSMNEAS
ncbi:hypothetical protein Ddye_010933 [Dipteronia dyeriana]|uniref:Reverse transcriptase n=1 Tax=Dipteronia dyeriana TaxID=168575 RepID=A0AAE0CNR2_9ROSI|nr:hypothetical protein Ddye_010933 [Dipteronia dyeriana]